jgi:hypothetical protein
MVGHTGVELLMSDINTGIFEVIDIGWYGSPIDTGTYDKLTVIHNPVYSIPIQGVRYGMC